MCTQQYLAYAVWDDRYIVGSYHVLAAVSGVSRVGYDASRLASLVHLVSAL